MLGGKIDSLKKSNNVQYIYNTKRLRKVKPRLSDGQSVGERRTHWRSKLKVLHILIQPHAYLHSAIGSTKSDMEQYLTDIHEKQIVKLSD